MLNGLMSNEEKNPEPSILHQHLTDVGVKIEGFVYGLQNAKSI